MGGRFDITIVAQDSLSAEQNIDVVIAEISRIENLISDWKPESQVSRVNQNAGIKPIKVDREVFELTKRGIKLSQETGGAFDISFAAMDRIWKFDGSMTEMPSPEAIKKSVEKVGYQNIILDDKNSTIFLKYKGMKIGYHQRTISYTLLDSGFWHAAELYYSGRFKPGAAKYASLFG